MGSCPVCGRPVVQPKTGRRRIYDRQVCRQAAYERRHPLGWRILADAGIEDRSLLRMLAEAGHRWA